MVIWKLSVCAEGGAVIKSRRRRLLPQLRLYVGQAKAASSGSGEGNAKKSVHYYGSPLAGGGGNTVGGGGEFRVAAVEMARVEPV